MAIKSFRDLIAWQKAKLLARRIHEITRGMPSDERFGLTAQMRRASVSVFSNIAEGFGNGTPGDFLRACGHARGSLFELMGQVELSNELGYIAVQEDVTALMDETDRVLQGLIRSIEDRRNN
jgi:four helix bundle protein